MGNKAENSHSNRIEENTNSDKKIGSLCDLGISIFKNGRYDSDFQTGLSLLLTAYKLSDSLNSTDLKNKTLLKTGEYYLMADSNIRGISYFLKVSNYYRSRADKKNEAGTLVLLARNFSYSAPNLVYILKYLNEAKILYRELKDNHGEIQASWRIAVVHGEQQKFNLAETEMLQVIALQNSIGENNHLAQYAHLSDINRRKGDLRKALKYSLATLDNMAQTNDTSYAGEYYVNLANIYRDLEKKELSIYWYRRALASFSVTEKHRTRYIYSTLSLLVQELITARKSKDALYYIINITKKHPIDGPSSDLDLYRSFASTYYALKDYQNARKYYTLFEKNIDNYIASEDGAGGARMYLELAQYFFSQKSYPKAARRLNQTLALPKGVISLTTIRDAHYLLSRVDSAMGNNAAALGQFKLYHAYNDSIFNTEKIRQIENLQIGYETEQKKRDIKLLQDREKIQQIKLQHTETTRNWIIGGAGMLILLLAVSVNAYLLKQKSNKIITHKNEMLQRLVTEKEWLLKEVHHRVKNNLHTVICLLESQAVYLENDALKAIENSQHRIYAMSLIHQKLYQSEDVKTIDMASYLPEFIEYLNDSFDTHRSIRFHLEIAHVQLGVSQAIPLALIINEAVTNAIKYAFPDHLIGVIRISMRKDGKQIILIIADNGIGMEPKIACLPLESLGLKLMNGLSEDIHGHITFENNRGTKITIVFQEDPLNDNHHLIKTSMEKDDFV